MGVLSDSDTITAIATPPGQGGVGIIRISGPQAVDIAKAICGHVPPPRTAGHRTFLDLQGDTIDQGLVLYFPQPHSFTGENVVELHGHGGPVVLNYLLEQITLCGARLAGPGEFSRRAFLNDKIDLVRAEAIADLISSQSVSAVKLASRTLQGSFSDRIHELQSELLRMRVYVEATLDFPDEEVELLDENVLKPDLQTLNKHLQETLDQSRHGRALREGLEVVFAGLPNAGKSTLLNTLSGRDVAIVTPVAGTTRDVLREYILIDDLPLHIIDTAGLRQQAHGVEEIGIQRAWQEIKQADRILYLVDASVGWSEQDDVFYQQLPPAVPATIVYTKLDLVKVTPVYPEGALALSARTASGMDSLKHLLRQQAGIQESGEGVFMARQRHINCLLSCQNHLAAGIQVFGQNHGAELLAEELRLAHNALCGITGEFSSEDLLGEIFSSFCIGK